MQTNYRHAMHNCKVLT